MSVKWTSSYDLFTNKKEHFRIFISEKDDGFIYASCLWYEGERVLKAPGQNGNGLQFHLKTVLGESSENAYQQITIWARKKFGKNITITEGIPNNLS